MFELKQNINRINVIKDLLKNLENNFSTVLDSYIKDNTITDFQKLKDDLENLDYDGIELFYLSRKIRKNKND